MDFIRKPLLEEAVRLYGDGESTTWDAIAELIDLGCHGDALRKRVGRYLEQCKKHNINTNEFLTNGVTSKEQDALNDIQTRRTETSGRVVPMMNGIKAEEQILIDSRVHKLTNKEISEKHGITESAVRSMLCHADTPRNAVMLMEVMQQVQHITARQRIHQEDIIHQSECILRDKQKYLRDNADQVVIMKINDIHFPYQRADALELTYQLIEYFQPHWITSLDDLFDFDQYGRWEKDPNPAAELWQQDINYAIQMADIHHGVMRKLSPKSTFLGITGNHDKRIYAYLRQRIDGFSEQNVTYFMEKMFNQGVLIFTNDGKKENQIHITPGLKLLHGVSASSNRSTVSKNTVEAARGDKYEGDSGIMYHTMGGHTHDGFKHAVHGVTHTNAPCLSKIDVGYVTHKPHWELGCAIAFADPRQRAVRTEVIRYEREGSSLVAYVGYNKKFSVEYRHEKTYRI